VEASPRRGIVRTEYSFLPAVRLSLLAALAINPAHFDAFSGLRAHLETAYWDEAVALLTEEDLRHAARAGGGGAWQKLSEPRIQIPYQEHRELHLTIYRRLDNPFVVGLLEAYWDCVRSGRVEHIRRLRLSARSMALSRADRGDAICRGEVAEGKRLLIEHMQLLSARGVAMETPALMNGAMTPAGLRACVSQTPCQGIRRRFLK
jgi:DNA-binding FadR family transcriptional regulator